MNAKTVLFSRVLLQLKEASPYFTTEAIAHRVKEIGLEIKDGTLPVYLSEATTKGLIHDAGRGWYSRLSKPVKLDPKPVAKLIRAVEKAFPLLEFTVWSTAQINPWMHHLLAHPVAFLSAPRDTLESVGDTLKELVWEVAVNPGRREAAKAIRPGEKMVVLRPTLSKQPPADGRQDAIEKVLVDLLVEASRFGLMDTSEAEGAFRAVATSCLLQIGLLQRYGELRELELPEISQLTNAGSL